VTEENQENLSLAESEFRKLNKAKLDKQSRELELFGEVLAFERFEDNMITIYARDFISVANWSSPKKNINTQRFLDLHGESSGKFD
jgi:hypothetical protein